MPLRRILLLILLACIARACPAQETSEPTFWTLPSDDASIRTVTVHAVAGPLFRERDQWEQSIRRRIAQASDVYKGQFRIRFEITNITTWDGVDERADLGSAFQALWMDVDPGDADIVIGFLYTGLLNPQQLERADAENLGRAAPFGQYVIVRDIPHISTYMRERTLIHEIGHLFGALHAREQDSVMHRFVLPGDAFRFDERNGERIWIARGLDFTRGAAAFDWHTEHRLTALYKADHRSDERNPLVTAHLNLAAQYTRRGLNLSALRACDRALAIDDANAPAHINRGVALEKLKRFNESADAFRAACIHDPSSDAAMAHLGGMLLRIGQPDEAINALREAIRLNSKNAPAHYVLGLALADRSDVAEALREYAAAVASDPSFAFRPVHLPVSDEELASLMTETEQAVVDDPDAADAHLTLGLLHSHIGRTVDGLIELARGLELAGDQGGAAMLLARAAELDQGNPALLHARGEALLAEGDFDGAAAVYHRCIEADPADARAYRGLGDALKGKGMLAAALRAYNRARDLSASDGTPNTP
ncbi:MAG: tetratricopeptide repeat protein [Phycisphaerales bacterium]|nr:tetratricopeptide repeat protein [Phycisphaerales bacterium]